MFTMAEWTIFSTYVQMLIGRCWAHLFLLGREIAARLSDWFSGKLRAVIGGDGGTTENLPEWLAGMVEWWRMSNKSWKCWGQILA